MMLRERSTPRGLLVSPTHAYTAGRWWPGACLLWLLAPGCTPDDESPARCAVNGTVTDCKDALVACARETGRLPGELCRALCSQDATRIYQCRSGPVGIEDGLYAPAELPREVAGFTLTGELGGLSCEVCQLWSAGSCWPDHTSCAPGDSPAELRQIWLCDEQGQRGRPIGECPPGHHCSGSAPGWEVNEPDGLPAPVGTAQCTADVCDPGVIRCPLDGPGLEVCAPDGRGWVPWTSCPAGHAARCSPDPVCLPVPGTACGAGCPTGSRCTTPGNFGEPRACAEVAAAGEACSGTTSRVCAADHACVTEAPRTQAQPPAEGVCRPRCQPSLNDCPASMACLLTAQDGVCSAAVLPEVREPCATGRPGVCSRGLRAADGSCMELVTPAGAELCDGLDNDCDGATDEDAVFPPGLAVCPEQGVCRGRPGQCQRGGWRCNYPPEYQATEQQCDGLDNDCDGQTDEGC